MNGEKATQRSRHMCDEDRLLSIGEVSDYLGVRVGTLYQWHHRRYGPIPSRVGGALRYKRSEILAWVDAQTDRRDQEGER